VKQNKYMVETNRGYGWAVEIVRDSSALAFEDVMKLRKNGIPVRVREVSL